MTIIMYDVKDFLSAEVSEDDSDFQTSLENYNMEELSEEDLEELDEMRLADYLEYNMELMEDDLE